MLWSHLPLSKTVRKNGAGPRQAGRKGLSRPALHAGDGTQERVDHSVLDHSVLPPLVSIGLVHLSARTWQPLDGFEGVLLASGCPPGMAVRPSLYDPWSCVLPRWPNLKDWRTAHEGPTDALKSYGQMPASLLRSQTLLWHLKSNCFIIYSRLIASFRFKACRLSQIGMSLSQNSNVPRTPEQDIIFPC